MQQIVDKLKTEGIKSSTKRCYYSAWRTFNQFFIRLDKKPDNWEDRIVFFVAYLIQDDKQSQTIRSYISAVKKVLRDDGIEINEDKMLLASLTKACKLKNDSVKTRLPIQKGMLRILLQTTADYYDGHLQQPFLAKLYRAVFITAYFGLLRVGEICKGSHPILVNDVHVAENKKKFMFLLRSSKTHGLYNKPQQIKIESSQIQQEQNFIKNHQGREYCPYKILKQYVRIRPNYMNCSEPFFVFSDRSFIRPETMRKTLKVMLKISGFDANLYNFQSFRARRAVDLAGMSVSLESIKNFGRWSSNSVFTYLKY